MKKIILASASPRRSELLHQIGLKFEVVPAKSEEKLPLHQTPSETVQALALAKATEVAQQFDDDVLVIGADTIVVLDDNILGKPLDLSDAQRMIAMLSGREHSVFTGLAVIDVANNRTIVDFSETKVFFRKLTAAEITAYINCGESLDKAGGYGIQGFGASLVERIDGCYFNVVGMPLSKLTMILQQLGVKTL